MRIHGVGVVLLLLVVLIEERVRARISLLVRANDLGQTFLDGAETRGRRIQTGRVRAVIIAGQRVLHACIRMRVCGCVHSHAYADAFIRDDQV
jgi:hypothetical protein